MKVTYLDKIHFFWPFSDHFLVRKCQNLDIFWLSMVVILLSTSTFSLNSAFWKEARRVLTSCVLLHLPQSPQQTLVALVAFVVLGVQQNLLGVDEQAGDSGKREGEKNGLDPLDFYWMNVGRNAGLAHMESLKLPTIPGLSPGVGLRKQGLLALQMIPCTHGRVPADGMALLGKWPRNGVNHLYNLV